MDEARDMMRISLAFTAGVGLSMLCARFVEAGPGAGYGAAVAALAATLLLMPVLPRQRTLPVAVLLFFCTGFFCHRSMLLGGGPAGWPGTGPGPLEELCTLIDSIPFPHDRTAPLLRALLTGRRDGLDPDTVRDFRASGAAHILALSGLHLGTICLLIRTSLFLLGRHPAARLLRSGITVMAAVLYAHWTGGSPSIVRAMLFITLGEIARNCPGRKRSNIRVFCTALLLQLSLRPDVLGSASFQLSYLAMLGIFVLFPRLEALYPAPARRDPMRRLWKALALSLSCQAFTAPVAWIHFHSFPKYFLITNLLALPLTELLMCSAAATVLLSAAGICPPLLVRGTDLLAETLRRCLEIIASL